jgi:hypothetical protein
MKRLGVAAALLVMASMARAQDAACTNASPASLRDACQKATDIFKYLSPQLGTTIAGGNSIMGAGGVLGGLPHWTVGVRGTLIAGSLPEFTSGNAPSATSNQPVQSSYTTSTAPIGFPAFDGAVGVFGGIPLGLTKIGGIDILANAAYVPTINKDDISIAPATNIQIGYGVKIGLLQESLIVPGVAVSIIQRGLPKTTITSSFASVGGGANQRDTLMIKDLDLKTTSMRLTVSKSLILFGVAAGVGVDKYKSSTDINVAINRTILATPQRFGNTTPFHVDSEMTRTNIFLDGYLNILLIKLVGEVGMVSGGELTTFNTFDKLPNATRPYGAFGIRVGF